MAELESTHPYIPKPPRIKTTRRIQTFGEAFVSSAGGGANLCKVWVRRNYFVRGKVQGGAGSGEKRTDILRIYDEIGYLEVDDDAG